MRIVEDAPSRLRLRDGSRWITLVCWGAAVWLGAYGAVVARQPQLLLTALLFGGFGLVFLRSTDATFDNGKRALSLVRLDIFKVTRREIPYSQISNVAVDMTLGGRWQQVLMCRLNLDTSDGAVPLSATFESGADRYGSMRDRVAAAVFGASAPAAPDAVERMVRSGNDGQAVALLQVRDRVDTTEAVRRVEALRRGGASF